jgi:hypothetical protein
LQLVEQLLIQIFFARQGALLGAERLVFEGLEFGGDEALGVFQGLAAAVIVGHLVELALRYLDEKTVYAVELDAQVAYAGARFLVGFEVQKKAVAVVLDGAQLIQVGVKPCGDDTAVAHQRRGLGGDGALQQLGAIAWRQQVVGQARQECLKTLQGRGQQLGFLQGQLQADQFARAHLAQRDARGDALHIGAALELVTQPGPRSSARRQGGAITQCGDGIQAMLRLGAVAPGRHQPAFQQPTAHAGHAGVE